MTRRVAALSLIVLVGALPASAQQGGTSSWGVVGTFVPTWEVTSTFEPLATVHFSEDEVPIDQQNLTGGEFRIGIARGRALGGDWGVAYVRRTFEDFTYQGSVGGGGCSGGGSGTGGLVLQCDSLDAEITRRDAVLNGIEVHKFISFVTIAQRVQIGLNLAGGYGGVSGQVDVKEFQSRFTCVYPPGVFPEISGGANTPETICAGATITNRTSVQTGASTDDMSRLMKSSTNMPIGRVELAAAFIVAPQFKLRVGGGFNYPGTNVFAITGVFFFRGD